MNKMFNNAFWLLAVLTIWMFVLVYILLGKISRVEKDVNAIKENVEWMRYE